MSLEINHDQEKASQSSSDKEMNGKTVTMNAKSDKISDKKRWGLIGKMRRFPCLGIFFAILYAFFMSSAVAFVKLVTIHPIEVLIFRSVIQFFAFLGIVIYNKRALLGLRAERFFIFSRSITGVANQCCWYISARLISLTDASAIYYSAPVFVAFLAYIFLREPFGIFEAVSIVVTILGVLTISKPSFLPYIGDANSLTGDHLSGLIYALAGAITFALSNICLRKLQKTSAEIISMWFSLLTIIFGSIYLLFVDRFRWPANTLEYTIIVASGICGVLGNIAFVVALKIEKAGPVSVAQTLNIVIVLIYQIAFFDEPVEINTLIGALLIGISVTVTGLKDVVLSSKIVENIKKIAINTVSWEIDDKTKSVQQEKTNADGRYTAYDGRTL